MKRVLAAICSLVLLTSCDFIAADTESLLHPPAINRRQAAIGTALEEALGTASIVYKYPQRGDFRTPFVFYDMDGDDIDEAFVFYSYQNDTANTRTMVLRDDGNGVWRVAYDINTNRDQVDFVQFANLLSPDSACMIVGWQSTSGQSGRSSALSVYSLAGESFFAEISQQRYLDYLVRDFDGDGLDEIVTIELDSDRVLRLSQLRAVDSRIAVSSSLQLSAEADTFLQMLPGKLWDGASAIFIDEIRTDTSVATEVVRVRAEGISILVGGERPADPAQELLRWESYTDTWRDEELLCLDVRGTGDIEVPYPVSLPGNHYQGQESPLKLTGLLKLTATGFITASSAVINEREGYLMRYPEQWLDRVTVLSDEDSGEWRFYEVDAGTGEPVTELLRIRTSTDPTPPGGYFPLDERGQQYYSGYLPITAEETPGITEPQLKMLFQVLP